MAEWLTCFDGCECSDCRQRRSDYFFVQSIKLNSDYQEEIYDDRLESAMDNLGYSKHEKRTLKDYRR